MRKLIHRQLCSGYALSTLTIKFKLRVLFFALYLQNQSHSFWSTKDDSLIRKGGDKKQKGTNRVWSRPLLLYLFTFYFNRRFDSLSSISTVIFGRSNLGENPHSALAQESSI